MSDTWKKWWDFRSNRNLALKPAVLSSRASEARWRVGISDHWTRLVTRLSWIQFHRQVSPRPPTSLLNLPSGDPPQVCPFLQNIQPQILQWWLLLSAHCKGHHKKRATSCLILVFVFLSIMASLHLISFLSLQGKDFLFSCSFPFFLPLPLFQSTQGSLPPVSCQDETHTHWAVLIDAKWTTPSDFVCLCLFSRLKFHLILRKGPGFGLEIHRPEKGLEAWFAFDKHWVVGFLFKRVGPTHLACSFLF